MNELNSLRSETYDAASKFILAQEGYFACFSQGSTSRITKAVKNAHTAGAVYKDALHNLINYIEKMESAKQVIGELSRMRQLADILDEELSLIALPRRKANILEIDYHPII
jgi:hypothetical protein